MDFKHVTTEEAVATYDATHNIFAGLLKEVRVLSGKKPDATLSQGKVKLINRVLADLREVLKKGRHIVCCVTMYNEKKQAEIPDMHIQSK